MEVGPSVKPAFALLALLALVAACGPESLSEPPNGSSPSPEAPAPAIQGYGKNVTGGAGGPVCMVTSSAETGDGTLQSCLAKGGRQIVRFSVSTVLMPVTSYLESNLTIDGCANGGVTLVQDSEGTSRPDLRRALVVEGPATNIALQCLRFQGEAKDPVDGGLIEFDLLGIDGEEGLVSGILIDRCTFVASTDGALDFTGRITDVTLQRSLFYGTPLTQLIKYDTRERFSIHHNVYTQGGERNPQVKGDMRGLDFVANVVHANHLGRDSYGTRVWNANSSSDSPGNVQANFRGNVYADGGEQAFAIITEAGASASGVHLEGNTCVPPGTCPASPSAVPFPIPAEFAIGGPIDLTTVGSPNRTAEDSAKLAAVAAAIR